MSNIPSIPPLFSSTPPPIDFDDEDDEEDSGLPPTLTIDEENELDFMSRKDGGEPKNTVPELQNVPSLPTTPIHWGTTSVFEAFNAQPPQNLIKATTEQHNAHIEEDSNEKTSNEISTVIDNNAGAWETFGKSDMQQNDSSEDEEDFQEFCTAPCESNDKSAETLPEHYKDALNLNSEPSIIREENSTPRTTDEPISVELSSRISAVKLEDLVDDSSDDELHSPKQKNLQKFIMPDDTDDFFAIKPIENAEKQPVIAAATHDTVAANSNENTKETTATCDEDWNHNILSASNTESFEDLTNFAAFENVSKCSDAMDVPFAADFEQFPNAATAEASSAEKTETADVANSLEADDFDDFDDFQDFTNAPIVPPTNVLKAPNAATESNAAANTLNVENEDVDDDDEFGDFSEAPNLVVQSNVLQTGNANVETTKAASLPIDLNQQLLPVLQTMFPFDDIPNANIETMPKPVEQTAEKGLKLDPIDGARALDYQWTQSDMRRSLIKSLGIDSRNILHGEKWNSSMPRYAANLSFDPLEPLKPQKTSQQPIDATQTSTASAIQKTDVPAVEFDWHTAGLVNPLDGSKDSNANTRETGTLYTTQPQQFDAVAEKGPTDFPKPSFSNDAASDANSFSDHESPKSAKSVDATAAAALSPTISADSLSDSSNNQSNNGNSIDLAASDFGATFDAAAATAVEAVSYIQSAPLTSFHFPATNFTSENTYDHHQNEIDLGVNNDEVIATSTYAGPLKETHIYTPTKSDVTLTTSKVNMNVDFDYEMAAAGIVIDETVVRKEYRDVEYNPGFCLEMESKNSQAEIRDTIKEPYGEGTDSPADTSLTSSPARDSTRSSTQSAEHSDLEEEFSDFQCVPAVVPTSHMPSVNLANQQLKAQERNSSNSSRTDTPTSNIAGEMILSPAILLPQAMSLSSNGRPKIEWGDSVASINPDEMARIEELFPQPKVATSTTNGYQTAAVEERAPSHTLSISAGIASKEKLSNDDDDWSEFISVPAPTQMRLPQPAAQNNNFDMASRSPIQRTAGQRTAVPPVAATVAANDEEWSDFVSSAPTTQPQKPKTNAYAVQPQFNSGAWQNANFYNNPMSLYHNQQPGSRVVPKMSHQQSNNNCLASNNNSNQYYQQQQQLQLQREEQEHWHLQQLTLQQQISVMQDFSTAPPYSATPARVNRAVQQVGGPANLQFQLGHAAKVGPSISLIPDLGFVAPAAATNTTYIGSLPKSGYANAMNK